MISEGFKVEKDPTILSLLEAQFFSPYYFLFYILGLSPWIQNICAQEKENKLKKRVFVTL